MCRTPDLELNNDKVTTTKFYTVAGSCLHVLFKVMRNCPVLHKILRYVAHQLHSCGHIKCNCPVLYLSHAKKHIFIKCKRAKSQHQYDNSPCSLYRHQDVSHNIKQ
jgi:hypothetical protein